jgi:hypothetical protein
MAMRLAVVCALGAGVAHADSSTTGVASKLECSIATADPKTKRAGGAKADPMLLACSPRAVAKDWLCSTGYDSDQSKTQHWLVTSRSACDVTAREVGCELIDAAGHLLIRIVAIEDAGYIQLRLDVDIGGTAIAAKVCSGRFVRAESK